MPVLIIILLISLFIPARKTQAQSNFEGIITFQIDTKDGGVQHMTYFVKNDKVRMEVETPNVPQNMSPAIIYDSNTNKMYTLISQVKSYMEVPINMNEQYNDSSMIDNKDMRPYKTGKTAKIAGVECEQWKAKTEDGSMELWNAKGFGNFLFVQKNGFFNRKNKQTEWAREMIKEGFFPFKIINYNQDGNEEMKMEVTDVTKKNLDASLFEIPSDYKKMNIPGSH